MIDNGESLDDLLLWYQTKYMLQMIKGGNIPRERMRQNLAVLNDAIYSYRTYREIELKNAQTK